VISESELPIALCSPRKTGYLFVGWYEDETYENHITDITQWRDHSLYAKWILTIDANRNVQEYPYSSTGDTLRLKELTYQFFYTLDTPGNPNTRITDLAEEKFSSEYQCPQGLCLTEDYIIVSSYALEKDVPGALTFYDRGSGEYVISFGMEANSHLGGIAYDGSYIWICHSNTKKLEAISYEFLKSLIAISSQNFIDITSCFAQYEVENVPSCITAKDGLLYVATHHAYTPGSLYVYTLQKDHLTKQDSMMLPSKVQGIAFDESGRLWLSRSYGRKRSSELWVYPGIAALKEKLFSPERKIEMPPGSEELVVEDELIYVLFETASYKYLEGSDGKGTCDYPIDKLLMINSHSLWYD
jgi:uncharacterized repeat protein (TIGR02543 family)